MDIERRIEQLEHVNRWYRRAAGMVISLVAATLLVAQAGERNDAIDAREFVVKDAKGTVRGRFGITDKTGHFSFLALYDPEGEQCFRVSAGPQRGFASLRMGHVREGIEYLRLTAGPKATNLVMFGRNRDTELVIQADEGDHSPAIKLHYKGLPVAGMGIADDGKPLLWIKDTKTLETIWQAPKQ